jgi:hypothetical protein
MKILGIFLVLLSTHVIASPCDAIKELGYPVADSCMGNPESIRNLDAQSEISEASICWGGFGTNEDGWHAVAVQMITSEGEKIDYVWEMPTGRANRTNVNDYTYFGTWKKGIFFEDQTTVREEGKFMKPQLRQGVVVNYRDSEVEVIKTYKPFWGKMQTIYDAYISCK